MREPNKNRVKTKRNETDERSSLDSLYISGSFYSSSPLSFYIKFICSKGVERTRRIISHEIKVKREFNETPWQVNE